MIKIDKLDEPEVLASNKTKWTTTLLEFIAKGERVPTALASKYNHTEVKDSLRIECKDKCMYCESVVAHVSYEHIEHIKPKAQDKYPDRTFEWDNLGLSCPVCNMNKGDVYDEQLPFINPYVDEPSDFILALGNMIYHKPGNSRGELTVAQLKLNRPELIERRKERLDSIIRLIDKYHREENATLKDALKEQIEIEVQNNKPYSLCAQSVFEVMM